MIKQLSIPKNTLRRGIDEGSNKTKRRGNYGMVGKHYKAKYFEASALNVYIEVLVNKTQFYAICFKYLEAK